MDNSAWCVCVDLYQNALKHLFCQSHMDADAFEVSLPGQRFVDHCMQDVWDDGGCVFGECMSVCLPVCVCPVLQCRLMLSSLSGRHRRRGNPTSITGLVSNTHSV